VCKLDRKEGDVDDIEAGIHDRVQDADGEAGRSGKTFAT
jgi:hypothetical protein